MLHFEINISDLEIHSTANVILIFTLEYRKSSFHGPKLC